MKEIKNRKDLESALSRLDEVWDSAPGDDGWYEREYLIMKIVDYEAKTVQIPPPDPEEAIRFRMEQEGRNENPRN